MKKTFIANLITMDRGFTGYQLPVGDSFNKSNGTMDELLSPT